MLPCGKVLAYKGRVQGSIPHAGTLPNASLHDPLMGGKGGQGPGHGWAAKAMAFRPPNRPHKPSQILFTNKCS